MDRNATLFYNSITILIEAIKANLYSTDQHFQKREMNLTKFEFCADTFASHGV